MSHKRSGALPDHTRHFLFVCTGLASFGLRGKIKGDEAMVALTTVVQSSMRCLSPITGSWLPPPLVRRFGSRDKNAVDGWIMGRCPYVEMLN